jgi:hypothetical protein
VNFLMQFRARLRTLGALVFGVVAIVLGAWYLQLAIHLVVSGDRVTGHVVEVMRTGTKDDPSYEPVVEYEVDGETYRRAASVSTPDKPAIGTAKEVLVHPDDPDEARIGAGAELWLTPAVLLVFGMLALAAVAYRIVRG